MGLPTGPVRIPGEEIDQKQKEMIKQAAIQMGIIEK
jgi:hypothetical protein